MLEKSRNIDGIELSDIVKITEHARSLKEKGYDVLSLSTGEPDFPTPWHICDAAIDAMRNGETKYTPVAGTKKLREAIAMQSGFACSADEVIVSTGAKQVLNNIFFAMLNHGDEVISPTPYWSSYKDIVRLAGGNFIELPCEMEQGFKLSASQLEAAITEKTRFVMLNSPSNPSGAVYVEEEYQAFADILKKHPKIGIICDEIYQHICYKPFISFRNAVPELKDRTIIVNGVSKAHSMTGWRLGWGIAPKYIIDAMVAVQGQSTSGASSISQAAALAALSEEQPHITERLEQFKKRRDYVVASLNASPYLSCDVPDGAFYIFVSCKKALNKFTRNGQLIKTDVDFCEFLLNEVQVAIVPGSAFGLSGYFRLSYAYSYDNLEKGCHRIVNAIHNLVKE